MPELLDALSALVWVAAAVIIVGVVYLLDVLDADEPTRTIRRKRKGKR